MKVGVITIALLTACAGWTMDVLLEGFSVPADRYPHTLGGEFKGAKATFAWTEQGSESRGALRIDYDFTDGGRYCQWWYAGWLPESQGALSFHANARPGTRIMIRLVDSTGQYHQYRFTLSAEGYQRIDLSLGDAKSTAHWSGADDGILHMPLTRVFIGPGLGEHQAGVLLIDQLKAQTDMTQAEVAASRMDHFIKTAKLDVEADEPGLLFRPDDGRELRFALPGVPDGVDEILVELECVDAYGAKSDALPATLSLTRDAGFQATLRAPPDPGYYEVSCKLTCRVGRERRAAPARRFSFAIIPARAAAGRQPDSPFGVNTHFNQGWAPEIGAIVKRVGIAWIRDGEASLADRALPVAKANNLCYLPCFTWYRKPLDKNRGADGVWDFADVAAWHREYAEKYAADIDAYDLVNEPHGPWSQVLGGDWSGGPWQEAFVTYGRQITEAIKAGDPGARVLWEDIDQLLWYRRFFELGAGDVIDVISPHPYNMHRSRPLPEEQPIIGQLPEFRRFMREQGLTCEVWSGEVGFSSYELTEEAKTAFYAPHTELQQAQMLVRMMILQLSAGVSKIFWYDFLNDGLEPSNPEHNFGLIRNDRTPKPAVVAYAYLIDRLTACRWLGGYAVGGGADACAFVAERSGKPVVIAWLRRGSRAEPLRVPGDARHVTITDIFGVASTAPVDDHMLKLELTETPVYIDGLAMSDVQPFLLSTAAPSGG